MNSLQLLRNKYDLGLIFSPSFGTKVTLSSKEMYGGQWSVTDFIPIRTQDSRSNQKL